jgi:NADPH:quinone reductase
VRELTSDGVDIALDPFGGAVSLRSFRALRPGGRLVIYGRQNTIAHGRKNWPAVFEWYTGTAIVGLWGLLSPRRQVLAYRVQIWPTSRLTTPWDAPVADGPPRSMPSSMPVARRW